MTRWVLILRGLRHFRRSHWAVFWGTAASCGVLTGALLVGGSVSHSLGRVVDLRLGRCRVAVSSGEHVFDADLAVELASVIDGAVSPVLLVSGSATEPESGRRANRVQVCGIDSGFWGFGPAGTPAIDLGPGEAVLSANTASQLGILAGDTVVLRVPEINSMPGGAPLASVDERGRSLRVTVRSTVDDGSFGRFSLRSEQLAPRNVFVSRAFLCDRVGVTSKANLLLVADQCGDPASVEVVSAALSICDLFSACGFRVQSVGDRILEISSDRVFIAPRIEQLVSRVFPEAERILTYFVNEIRFGSQATPYSFVTGSDGGWLPDGLGASDLVLNSWASEDLGAGAGDEVTLSYFAMRDGGRLEEVSRQFRVQSVIAISGRAADRGLMPPFPGLAEAESCVDWDPDIPIDLGRVRDKDERYWDEHGGTPKAFVSLDCARRLWSNRFGALTAVRLAAEPAEAPGVMEKLNALIAPSDVGLVVLPVRELGTVSSREGVDFGQLFLGLSFFIIVSALLLTGLFYSLGLLDRRDQVAILHAVGFQPRVITSLFVREAFVVSAFGSLLGCVLAIFYNDLMLAALSSVWSDTVGGVVLVPHVSVGRLLGGGGVSLCCAVATVWWLIRRMGRLASRKSRELVAGGSGGSFLPYALAALLLLACGGGVVFYADPGRGKEAAGIFFGAGALLLSGYLLACRALFAYEVRAAGRTGGGLSLNALGGRNAARCATRSTTVVAALSCSIFLVVAVGANRHGTMAHAHEPWSGTGGFDYYVETALPVPYDLTSDRGRDWLGASSGDLLGVDIVQFLVSPGDDASCLNLNRTSRPTILGVAPGVLADRGSFTFAKVAGEKPEGGAWSMLEHALPNDEIPAVADQTVLVWGLGLDVGDTLTVKDEQGIPRTLRFVGGLANSVLQGNVLVAEERFRDLFPSTSGSRVLLVDGPDSRREHLASILRLGLRNRGPELVSCIDRLAAFAAVENTYLAIFLSLGGLGVLLGSVGLGTLVLRNIAERQGELALMRAVGYSRQRITGVLLREHVVLVFLGVLGGAFCGAISVLPAVSTPGGGEESFGTVCLWVCGISLSGFLWVLAGSWLGLRGVPITALRRE